MGKCDNDVVPKIIGDSLADHREQVRQRLFAAIRSLIAERGYDQITLADIAAAADVGRTAIYNHFPDKEAVLLAMVEEVTDEYVAVLRESLAATTDPMVQLGVYVRSAVSELAGQHFRMAGLGAVLSEEGRRRVMAHVNPMMAILTDILQRGMRQGVIPEQNIDTLTTLVSAATVGRTTLGLSGARLEQATQRAVDFVLRGVGASGYAAPEEVNGD